MKKKLTLLSMLVLVFSGGLMSSGSRDVDASNTTAEIIYQAHLENSGWQNPVKNGALAGTTGQALRLEAFKVQLANISGSVEYSAHVQHGGWQNFVRDGEVAGTTGQALRLEAIKVKLTGDAASKYDVYYRSHIEHRGWLPWQKNGEVAGTTGQSLRLEGVEMKLVAKGSDGAKVVELAHKQIGVPYRWAGTTPAGFDCSGLTQYVYKHALGKDIGRVTTNQERSGTVISLDQAQPGDLVFWGSRGATGHVGIYIGNGKYIHSPSTGKKVEIQSVTWSRPNFAVRVK